MEYEARARELVLHAQNNLEALWARAQGSTAGDYLDSFTTNPTELNRLRNDYVKAAGAWLGEALVVLQNAPRGPYVDHLGAWYNTVQLQRDKLLKGGWGQGSPTGTFAQTLPGEIGAQAQKLAAGGGIVAGLVLVLLVLYLLKK